LQYDLIDNLAVASFFAPPCILTDDVDCVSDVTEDDRSFASHFASVVSSVAILHVCSAMTASVSNRRVHLIS